MMAEGRETSARPREAEIQIKVLGIRRNAELQKEEMVELLKRNNGKVLFTPPFLYVALYQRQ
jgi:hypothetical protein